MTVQEKTASDCRRFEELALRAFEAAEMTAEEKRFLDQHPVECEQCSQVARALQAIRFDSDDVPCDPVDELTTRRVINNALEQVDRPPVVAEDASAPPIPATSSSSGAPTTRRRRLLWVVGGLSLGAGALAATVVLTLTLSRKPSSALDPTGPGRVAGRITLVSGAVETARGPAAVGETIAPSDRLLVREGRAAFHADVGASFMVGPSTALEIHNSNTSPLELCLDTGELVAVVTPSTGAPKVTVRVHGLLVTVTGTVFSVRCSEKTTEVYVLRGTVEVAEPGRSPRRVTAGRLLRSGGDPVAPIPRSRERALWRQVNALDQLDAGSSAVLRVRSDPAGATVAIDGSSLGITPLTAALKVGHRRLDLNLPRYTSIQEHVLLSDGTTSERDFTLQRETSADASTCTSGKEAASGAETRPPATIGNSNAAANPRPGGMVGRRQAAPRHVAVADDGWRRLLRLAQQRRAARDWTGAAKAYRELIRRYPRRAEAATALVSLGFLQLDRLGQAAAALRSFRRYLARSKVGAVAREAFWGEAQALRRLGRRQQEARALREFLRRFPGAIQAKRARRRLQALSAGTPVKPAASPPGVP